MKTKKMVMMTRIIAEIISSMLYERLCFREGGCCEGGSRWSDCFGRAMSEADVCVCLVERGTRVWRDTYVGW